MPVYPKNPTAAEVAVIDANVDALIIDVAATHTHAANAATSAANADTEATEAHIDAAAAHVDAGTAATQATEANTHAHSIEAKVDTLDTNVDTLNTRLNRFEQTTVFWSPSQEAVVVTDAAPNLALPSVVLPNQAGTITHVYAGFKFRMVENTNAAANSLDSAQYIQVNNAAEGLVNAIAFVDTQYSIAALTREGGDVVMGNIDLQAAAQPVDAFNVTVTFQWTAADAHLPNLEFNDVQTFLVVKWY